MSIVAQTGSHVVAWSLRAERARTLAEIHAAVCRYRRQSLVCSTCSDLDENAARLARLAGKAAA